VSSSRFAVVTRRWAPYALAGFLIMADFVWLSRGLFHAADGYRDWALSRGLYSDIVALGAEHYLRGIHMIHPIPYLHDRIEYPILLGFALWLPSWLPAGPASWFAVTGLMTAAATFGSIALVRRQSPSAVWWIAASPALLIDSGINWDLIGIVFLVGAVVWFGESRYRASGAFAGIGACFKLFPVIVAPLAVAALGSRWRRALAHQRSAGVNDRAPGAAAASRRVDMVRWVVPFVVVSAVVTLPFLVLAPSNTLYFYRFNSVRPLKDSVWILAQNAVGDSAVSNHVINTASFLLVAAVTLYAAWMVWRAPDADHPRALALATALVIIVWMAVNKIWNPQYILWVFAAGAVASMPGGFGVALGAVAVFDYVYEFVLRLPSRSHAFAWAGYTSIVARSLLFAAMGAWTVMALQRLVADRTAAPAPPEPVRSAV
jgi:hypothetical protein